ncbi:hypothetical protein BsWGS_02510 [Bradybaena similaris]
MGLSKKLGGATQKVPASPVVPYKWSNQTYTVAEILKKFKLPCVVQCATDDSCTVVWSDFQFDLKQPLLLYSKRSAEKVHAVSLKQTNDVLEEIGPPLAIPADYEGWFGAAPKGLSKAKRHFRIESIANTTSRRFLVTTKCPAFTRSHGHEGSLQFVPHDIMPGETLRRVCVLDSDVDDPDCPDLVRQHGPCLECLDDKDEDVVIPLSYATLSYEVADTYPDEESRVFQIPSLVEAGNTKLPRILNLIHGDPPLLAYAFTGTVRCYSVFSEETILAATLEDPGSRCLELITDSCVRFRLGLNEVAVKKTCEYTSAFQMCENFGAKFVTKIKVSFTLKPDVSDTAVVDVSTSESTSDMQDVEATSEFDITWGSVKKAKLLMASSLPKSDASNQVAAATAAAATTAAAITTTAIITEPVVETTAPIDVTSLSDDQSPIYNKIGSHSDDPSPVYGKICETEMPQHRDFTEQEILKLMLKKGMMESTDLVDDVPGDDGLDEPSVEIERDEASVMPEGTEPPLDSGSLHGNRVTDNPLFYFFQRHPEQNPWKPTETIDEDPEASEVESSSDDCQEENLNLQKRDGNPLGYLFTQPPIQPSSQADAKNPLSYLFEPMSNQTSSDRESRKETTADKKKDDCSANVQPGASSVKPESELHFYNKMARRTARVYSGSDEDDDDSGEEEEEDSCSDTDNSSETSEPSGIRKELYHEEAIRLPVTTTLTNSGQFQTQRHPVIEIRGSPTGSASKDSSCASSLKRLKNSSPPPYHQINTDNGSAGVDLYSEETEAVNDLFTLVDMESIKDSSTNSSKCSMWLQKNDGPTFGVTESQQKTAVKTDTVDRLNTLLEEVSEIVSTSSDRILDSNKDLRNISPDITNATSQSSAHSKTKTKTNDNTMTVSGEPYTRTLILGQSRHSGSFIDTDSLETAHPPDPNLDEIRFKRGDLKSRFNDRFHPELNVSNAETSPGIIRRSNTGSVLPQIDQERMIQSKTRKLHNAKPREPSLSSIFSVIKGQKANSNLSKTNSHQDGHSRYESTEIDDSNESLTTLDSDRKYPFPYKNQRVLSLTRGNIVSSFQNLDRLNSSNDSGSSNRSSSSLDNSYFRGTQGVPRLVVIGDNDLIVQNTLPNSNGHDREMMYAQECNGYTYELSSGECNPAEAAEQKFQTPERYAISKSGKFRPNKLSRPQTNVLLMENDGDFLPEDYV